jgi:iron-sulfur cluster insertion protein
MNIIVTDGALKKIRDISDDDEASMALRMYIIGGGCSGFQYGFGFDGNIQEDDYVIENEGIKVVVDAMSYQYLAGSTLDYESSLIGSRFIVLNPNALTSCGCGSSFSV